MFVINVWDEHYRRNAKAIRLEDDENWDERVDAIADLVADAGGWISEYGNYIEVETDSDSVDVEVGNWVIVSGDELDVYTDEGFSERYTEVK